MATEQIPVESNPRRLLILIVGVEVATVAFLSMALYFALRQVSGRVILLLPLDLDPSPKPSCGIGDAPGLRRSTDISAANMADLVVPLIRVHMTAFRGSFRAHPLS
jgi:hypothetical protein